MEKLTEADEVFGRWLCVCTWCQRAHEHMEVANGRPLETAKNADAIQHPANDHRPKHTHSHTFTYSVRKTFRNKKICFAHKKLLHTHSHCEPTLAITITWTTSKRGEIDARDRDRDGATKKRITKNLLRTSECHNFSRLQQCGLFCRFGSHRAHTLSHGMRSAVDVLLFRCMYLHTSVTRHSFLLFLRIFIFVSTFSSLSQTQTTTRREKERCKKKENKNFTRKNMWLKFPFIVDTYWTNVHTTSPSSTSEVFIIFFFLKSAECESIASNAMKMTEPDRTSDGNKMK